MSILDEHERAVEQDRQQLLQRLEATETASTGTNAVSMNPATTSSGKLSVEGQTSGTTFLLLLVAVAAVECCWLLLLIEYAGLVSFQ